MDTLLDGIRIVEVGDELTAYTGRLLAGMGADVIVVEPPGGAAGVRLWRDGRCS